MSDAERLSAALDPPRAVLFDLGNVLCRFDWHQSLKRLAVRLAQLYGPRAPRADEIVAWLLSPAGPHDPYCVGAIDDAQMLHALHARLDPQRRLADAWLTALWCDMFTPLPESLALVDALRGQVHCGLISNTNPLHFRHLDALLGLRHRFDALTLSFEVRAQKPDPRIFAAALAAAGVLPEQAYFIDDVPAFTAAARALGLRASTFTDAARLRDALAATGLPVSAARRSPG